MKVAVYGAGGVGGYFGGRLAASGADVTFITRGDHLRALHEGGLRVRSVRGDFAVASPAATDRPADVGPVDYVLIAVKSQHTPEVAAGLGPLLHGSTAVISLQNGVANEEKLAAAIGADHVVGGAAYIFATIAEPGVIEHTGGHTAIVVGEWVGGRSERVNRFVEACRAAGFGAEESDDIRAALWTKFALICALAGTTAAIRLPIGRIREAPASRELFRRVVSEVCDVARAEGIGLSDGTVDRHVATADKLDAGAYSSLHYDLTHGKPMELEALLGEVVRRARRLGTPAPMSEALYAVLQPWQSA